MKSIKPFIATAAAFMATMDAAAQFFDTTAVERLNEIVVTGTNSAAGRNLIPYAVSVVGEKALASSGQTRLLSILSGRVPGMFVTERGILGFGVSNGGSGHIKIRGVGGDKASAVLMMVDGQPQFAGLYSHHIADFYSKEYVEKVEVLRGPASVLYGSNAMAGVINVITKNAKDNGTHATLTSQFGSYCTWQTAATATARYGRFSAVASAGYDRTDGNMKGMDFNQWNGYAKAAYGFSDNWKGAADFTIMNFKGNDPIYPKLSDPESTDVYHQNITRGEASLTFTNDYGPTDGSARLYYSYGNHFIDDPRHFHSLDDRLGMILYQNFSPWKNAGATIGFDFDRYTGKIPVSGGVAHVPGAMGTIERKHITEYSPYLTISQGLLDEQITLSAGLRMANSDMFGTQWVPQAGFTLSPLRLFTFKFSAAMGYRNPSFRELYLYRMANPELNPEKMWNYEVSLGKNFFGYLDADITAFFSQGSNIIQTIDMKNENTGSFINKGIEISVSSHPLDILTLWASYSYLHTSLDNLTGAPRNQYFIGADWNIFKPLNVCAELKATDDLFVSKDIRDQNYVLVNLKASYQICPQLSLFVRLDNITDTGYVINKGYDMPGFTAMGGFKLSI